MINDAIKGFERQREKLKSPELRKNIGVRVVELFKRHIGQLEATRPNQQGFPRQHFWGAAAKSTNYRLTTAGLQIAVSAEGFAQRVYGGIIRPVNAKALTIPVNPEAYGKRASIIPNLYFVPMHKGNVVGMLVQRNLKRAIKKQAIESARSMQQIGPSYEIGTVFYLLVKQVRQKPDPTVVPSQSQIDDAVQKSVDNYLARQ